MKIFISAYACEPNKGSEPGVGWNWVNQIAIYNEVHVLTRHNNKEVIENVNIEEKNEQLIFHYYDLPMWIRKLKKVTKWTHFYYYLWQIGALFQSRKINKKEKFDLAHHITFASFKTFSFLAFMNIPFVLGPVGGGEQTPKRFYFKFPIYGILIELIRDINIYLSKYDPLLRKTWRQASKILVTTEQTKNHIPKKFWSKIEIFQTIGMEEIGCIKKRNESELSELQIYYIGNLFYWKGVDLVVESFYKYNKTNNKAKLKFIGTGPEKKRLLNKIEKYNLEKKVEFLGALPRNDVIKKLKDADVLLFPSFHDSGAMVVLEAMANYVPVICLNLGGPGNNVTELTGFKVDPLNYDQTINDLAAKLEYIDKNPSEVNKVTEEAINAIKHNFLWGIKVKKINNIYESLFNK